ncbi:MAG: PEGA domain-containing protein [Proteobacteria bacterium]|nr:PEGA domain-containing protein [Pseudomonadota bacterium]
MTKYLKLSALPTMILLLNSCATLFSERSDKITIKSEPSGADVFINEELKGKTPLVFDLDRQAFKEFKARVKLPGYESSEFRINKTLNTVSIFNTTSILSWATDALSGKMIQYSPTGYYAELKKLGKNASLSPNEQNNLNQIRFALVNFQKLQSDIARGEGEYLNEYLNIACGDHEIKKKKKDKIKNSSQKLLSISDAKELHDAIKHI